jgi:hypothetical protein
MKCRACGAKVDRGLVVCPECHGDPMVAANELSPAQLDVVAKKVGRKLLKVFLSLAGVVTLFLGGSLWEAYRGATRKLEGLLVDQIRLEFEAPKIKSAMESVAKDEAAVLLRAEVHPAVTSFKAELGILGKDINSRLSEFDSFLKSQQDAIAKSVEAQRVELKKLQDRNDITALADKAIADGDVEAYRKLESLAEGAASSLDSAALAELFRVYHAYSPFAPTRWPGLKLNPTAFDAKKTKEEDLDAQDLYSVLLKVQQPEARARIATLLSEKGKVGSFATAQAIVRSLKNETHLEVIKRMRGAFTRVAGYNEPGKLDARELLVWWNENEDSLRKKDTDKPAELRDNPDNTKRAVAEYIAQSGRLEKLSQELLRDKDDRTVKDENVEKLRGEVRQALKQVEELRSAIANKPVDPSQREQVDAADKSVGAAQKAVGAPRNIQINVIASP